MITLNNDQKDKLLQLIKMMPVDDATKQKWTEAVMAEKTPKYILFDIASTIEAVDMSREKLTAKDKEIADFFAQMHSDLEECDQIVATQLEGIEQEVKNFEQELESPETPAQIKPSPDASI